MADIKICDRCGKRIDRRRTRGTLKRKRTHLLLEVFQKCGQYVEFADLCEECVDAFEKWLGTKEMTE